MGADPVARAMREAATQRLALLDQRGELSTEHVELIAYLENGFDPLGHGDAS